MTSINEEVHGPQGFTMLSISPSELAALREVIREQWLYRLQLVVPNEVHKFAAISMDQYHQHADLVDHAKIWPKISRVLPASGAKLMRSMAYFKRLEAEYGEIIIGDEENFGWENITWRLVRPQAKDVGPIHADEWFYEVRPSQKRHPGFIPVKIWMAVYCNAGKNGLRVVPGSHRMMDKYKYRTEIRNDLAVPVYDGNEDELPATIPKTNPGDLIVFNHFLLHGGVWNNEATTRVSIDFTIFVNEKFKK
ncbi:MAG TPA: phytanoyl-CoA dioxygenase family protein [Verrucomicrobiae bacterium]|nr:phytanoyl-CoA dioxygenase family protein [Verrucomicrobiae bacterium]